MAFSITSLGTTFAPSSSALKPSSRCAIAMISSPDGGGSTTLPRSNCSAYSVKFPPKPSQPSCGGPFEYTLLSCILTQKLAGSKDLLHPSIRLYAQPLLPQPLSGRIHVLFHHPM